MTCMFYVDVDVNFLCPFYTPFLLVFFLGVSSPVCYSCGIPNGFILVHSTSMYEPFLTPSLCQMTFYTDVTIVFLACRVSKVLGLPLLYFNWAYLAFHTNLCFKLSYRLHFIFCFSQKWVFGISLSKRLFP